jgi:crotonobetainyl-CoA:carnitine CoA-transferase CaiB-like acyl-CoA transferase
MPPEPLAGAAEGDPAGILDDLLSRLDRPPSAGAVEFAGADPVLPTAVRIGAAGAAAIAACALEAARLLVARGGPAQRVRVEVDAAAAAMRSARYLRTEGQPERPGARGRGLGIYRTRDRRWIYFQRLFPHHTARLLEVLGCADEEQLIQRAVAGWDGPSLEEAVVASGACAAMVRTPAEWAAHGQGRAVAAMPLLDVRRIGDSPPEPLPGPPPGPPHPGPGSPSGPGSLSGLRPLSGLRVLDVTRVLAGPTCARTLAEHGAQVLRIGTLALPDNPAMMLDTGHGKRSAALDLRSESGAGTLAGLIRGADVFSQGYRPGALDRLGFSPEAVAAARPGIVTVSVSAFGPAGPWRARRGFDSVIQAASGLVEWGAAGEAPRFLPANPLDYLTGYLAAFGVLVALHRRASEGGSYQVRVSLAQTGRWLDGLGRVPAGLVARCAPDLDEARLRELMMSRDTPAGRLRYLAPVAELGATPGRWDLPTVPLDHDPARW